MTMRLTPNKIVGFTVFGICVMAVQNRMQSRVLMRQVAELKEQKLEDQLKFRSSHPSSSAGGDGSNKQ